jgi:hypothetical protein
MGVSTVHANQIDLTKTHMKRNLSGQRQNGGLHHAVSLDVAADTVPFTLQCVNIGGIDGFHLHFPICALGCKEWCLNLLRQLQSQLGGVYGIRYTVKRGPPIRGIKYFVDHVCSKCIFLLKKIQVFPGKAGAVTNKKTSLTGMQVFQPFQTQAVIIVEHSVGTEKAKAVIPAHQVQKTPPIQHFFYK